MAEEDAGLELPVGITLTKLTRQLAQAEARMARLASDTERRYRRSNTRVAQSFDQVTASTRNLTGGNGLRMVALQLNQVGQQGAVTGDYLRALSIQMPDLLLAFGTFGALAGTAVGVLAPFITSLFQSSEGVDKLVDSLVGGQRSLDSVRGSISQLRDLQEKYTAAVEASGNASGPAADAIVANTKREFEARKQMLAVEIDLLRIRGRTQALDLAALQSGVRQSAADAQASAGSSAAFPGVSLGADGDRAQLEQVSDFVNVRPRRAAEVPGLENFQRDTEQATLAIQELRAQMVLTDLAVDEATTAMTSDFQAVEAAVSGGGGGSSSGGGGGGRSSGGSSSGRGATPAVQRFRAEVEGLAISADSARPAFQQLFAGIVSGANSGEQAVARMLSTIASAAGSAAGGALFDLAIGGPMKTAGVTMLPKLLMAGAKPFARGGVVDGPTLFPMANGAGLMGEAGPEAVMPLKRGPDGRLGVAASGAGGGVVVNYTPTINAPGAGPGVVGEVRRMLDEERARLPAAVAGINRRARRSGAADAWEG